MLPREPEVQKENFPEMTTVELPVVVEWEQREEKTD